MAVFTVIMQKIRSYVEKLMLFVSPQANAMLYVIKLHFYLLIDKKLHGIVWKMLYS